MDKNEEVKMLEKIDVKLTEISIYLRLLSYATFSHQINAVASTLDRQQMWRLADGLHSNEEIANSIGVSLRSVQYFIQEAEDVGFIISEKRGYPKRVIDIIPREWKPWTQTKIKKQIEPIVKVEGKI